MGWEVPWYTLTDDFDADFGVDEWHGTNAFYRDDEDRVFRTYFINSRGDEALGSAWAYLDMTALGRQEDWEDSPRVTRRPSRTCGGTCTTNTTSQPSTRRPSAPSPKSPAPRVIVLDVALAATHAAEAPKSSRQRQPRHAARVVALSVAIRIGGDRAMPLLDSNRVPKYVPNFSNPRRSEQPVGSKTMAAESQYRGLSRAPLKGSGV